MKEKGSKAGWGFWLGWVLASTVGIPAGFIIGFFLGAFTAQTLEGWPIDLAIGIGIGIGVGVPQWLVLRRRVSRAGWWILASAAGGVVIFLAFSLGYLESMESFGDLLSFTGVVALGGAVAGILQWLVLRGKVSRAGWWVLASTVGWALGMAVSEVIPWGGTDEDSLVPSVMTGVVLGAVTGAALVWLLRQSAPEAQLE